MSTQTMTGAFRILGVAPDADAATVRAAWRALVRRYHPDQARADRSAADQRLAQLNAAYDLVSSWQPNADQHAAGTPRHNSQPHRARRPGPDQTRRKASEQRSAEDAAARRRAEALDRAEAAKRAARKSATRPAPSPDQRAAATARARFLTALRSLDTRAYGRLLGFA